MKYIYIVVQICENDKFDSYMLKVTENDNLIAKLKIDNIITANIYNTKKEAGRVVEMLTELYKNQKKYMFDETF